MGNLYVLILCLIVFFLLALMLFFLIIRLYKADLKLIKAGVKDSEVKRDFAIIKSKQIGVGNKIANILSIVFTVLIWILIIIIVATSLYITFTEDNAVGSIPLLKTVESGSMSQKLESNTYLFENNLDDQFTTNDLILVHKLPAITDLKQYDIVLYEIDGKLIIHRIININYSKEDPTLPVSFELRGDNVEKSDVFLVEYSNMKGIYKGAHIPVLGGFIRFLRSPAGILCIIFVALVTLILPYVDNKLLSVKLNRLLEIGYISEESLDKRCKKLIKK